MARILLLMPTSSMRIAVVTALRDSGQVPVEPPADWEAPDRLVSVVDRTQPDVVVISAEDGLDQACERCEGLVGGEHTRFIPTLVLVPEMPEEADVIRVLAAGARDLISTRDPLTLLAARIDNMARLNYLRRTFRLHHDALVARNQELDRIFETVTSGLAIADHEGRIVRMNARGREILGSQMESFVLGPRAPSNETPSGEAPLGGGPVVIVASVANTMDHPLNRAAVQGESVHGQRVDLGSKLKGDERVLTVDAEPLWGETGQRIGGLAVFRDETEAIRLHELLRDRSLELAMRTEEMEAFVFTAAHDMKSPLWTIRRYTTMLKEDHGEAIGTDGVHLLDRMHVNAVRLGRLVEDLVNVVKVGKMELFIEPMPLERPIRDALRNLDGAVRECGAVVDVPDDLPTIHADPDRMVDLFENLLGNAIKYRKPDEPCRVRVRANETIEGVHVRIEDDGVGIPADQFERIFALFQRLHTRDQIEGSGLGLAIVQRIVDRHGGRIWVESTVGQGSTFHVVLRDEPPLA